LADTPAANVELDICATCSAACPVHTDTRAYVELIARGKYEEAFEKIRQFNPFPSVCSLICHHPCEQACRRETVDDPVALRNLKRFAAEQAMEHRQQTRHKAETTHPETLGIVGSGPAGLTVAHDCLKAGYAVTVYEALPRPGGYLSCGIPKYRLPDDIIQTDIDDLIALGVDVQCGVRVGEDVSIETLRERHDALVLAVGLADSRAIPIENDDHAGVVLAIPFLRDVALGHPVPIGKHVLVIGGGNVAVDVARTAIRLGAETVKMVCLEDEAEMPAWEWECLEALEEGIEIVHRRGPKAVASDSNGVQGLIVREVERVFDADGRFSPTYFDDRLTTLEGDMIIVSIGQAADLTLLDGTDIAVGAPGRLVFDPETMACSQAGVFACGEVVTGPGAAIEAVASGHRAAKAALGYIETGTVRAVSDDTVEEVRDLPQDVVDQVRRVERLAMPTLSAEERRRSFEQFELGYSEKDALAEARRCLSCAAGAVVDEKKCESCLTCLRVCPFGVPVVEDVAAMYSEMCQSCGLCAVECPALAISIQRFAVGDIKQRVIDLIGQTPDPVRRVELVCYQDAENREELQDRLVGDNGSLTAIVPVSCAGRVEEVDMMKPFELGADAVVIRRCEECRYRGTMDRLGKRVQRTQQLLSAAGIDGDHLTLE